MTNAEGTRTYTYNNRYELTSSVIASVSEAIYQYDPVGNRTTVTESGTPSSYTPNNLNQYSSVDSTTYTYDLNGNLINDGDQIYEYDYENRLIRVTPAPPNVSLRDGVAVEAIYQYDPFGRRITKTIDSTATTFLYDGDQIIETYPCNLTTGTCSLNQSFLYGSGIDEPLELTDHPSLTKHYYHQDGLGSVTQISDATGTLEESTTYSPYGIPSAASSLGNPYLFTGREYDFEVDLYFYRTRHYHPVLGRFIQRDSWPGLVEDPSQLVNKYAYVINNPINFIDPFGREKKRLETFDPAADAIEPIPLWEDPIFMLFSGLKPKFLFKINVPMVSEPTHIGLDFWGRNIIHICQHVKWGWHIGMGFNRTGTALLHIYKNRFYWKF